MSEPVHSRELAGLLYELANFLDGVAGFARAMIPYAPIAGLHALDERAEGVRAIANRLYNFKANVLPGDSSLRAAVSSGDPAGAGQPAPAGDPCPALIIKLDGRVVMNVAPHHLLMLGAYEGGGILPRPGARLVAELQGARFPGAFVEYIVPAPEPEGAG